MTFLARSFLCLFIFGGSASAFASTTNTSSDKSDAAPENHPVARSLAARLHELARTDPAAAFATYGPDLWKYGDGFLNASRALILWAERDPAAPLVWLGTQPHGEKRNSAVRRLYVVVPRDADFLPIAEALLRAGPAHRATVIELCSKWAEFDPGGALEWIESLPEPALRAECIETANSRHHVSEPLPFPQQTLRLVLALPEGERRDRQLTETLKAWVMRDPAAAETWGGRQSAHDVASAYARAKKEIAEAIERADTAEKLGFLAHRDPVAAIAEWEELPDDQIKATAIDLIIESWMERDPAAALRWSLPRHKRISDLGIDPLVPTQGQRSIPGLSRYILDRDPVYAWAKTAPLEALRWAEEAPRWRDDLLRRLGGNWTMKPARLATAELYLQIRDPALRIQTLRRHIEAWSIGNAAAAQAWVESSSALTAEQRAALLAAAPNGLLK